MAVDDLPLPVVNFLNVIGVPWPYIDEDVLVEFALDVAAGYTETPCEGSTTRLKRRRKAPIAG
jgi:hypothetical protein